MARFRCGNELRGRQCWREKGERTCRICEEGEEDIKHVLRECSVTEEDIREEEFLDERGIGLPIMQKIVNERARRKEKEVKKCNSGETWDQRLYKDLDSSRLYMLRFFMVRNRMIMHMYILVYETGSHPKPKGKD